MAATYDELMAKAKALHAEGRTDDARRVAKIALSRKGQAPTQLQAAQPQTSALEQGRSGFAEGVIGSIGAAEAVTPMGMADTLAGVANYGLDKAGFDARLPRRKSPGAEALQGVATGSGLISETQPQTAGQRYTRRIAQEAGAMALPGGAMARRATAPAKLIGLEAASAVGAGGAGQAVEDMGGGQVAQALASVAGGVSPAFISKGLRKGPTGPTIDDVRTEQADAYGEVANSQARLTPDARNDLVAALKDRIAQEGNPEFNENVVKRYAGKVDALDQTPRFSDVEDMRRRIGRDVAGHGQTDVRNLGVDMKNRIDESLQGLSDDQITDGSSVVEALKRGRNATQRIKKYEDLQERLYQAENQAGSNQVSNEVDTIRQKFKEILKSPKARRGYSADEIAQMEEINRGTFTQNRLRFIGKASPTSGFIPSIMAGGAGTAAAMGGNPALAAIPAIGFAAKTGSEVLTKKSVDRLLSNVLNGSTLPKKSLSETEKSALLAAIAARGGQAGTQR